MCSLARLCIDLCQSSIIVILQQIHTLKYKQTKDTRSDLPSPERLEHKWIEVLWPCSFWWDDVSWRNALGHYDHTVSEAFYCCFSPLLSFSYRYEMSCLFVPSIMLRLMDGTNRQPYLIRRSSTTSGLPQANVLALHSLGKKIYSNTCIFISHKINCLTQQVVYLIGERLSCTFSR